MRVNVEIETHDPSLDFDDLETSQIQAGMEKRLSPDLSVRYEGTLLRKALDFPRIISITLEIGSALAVGIAANWLYDKLRGRATKIRIERTEVRLERGEIKRIFTEKIERT